jgi:hypothetical protein
MDARLGEALRSALPRPPVEQVDWPALRGRIARDAQPALARLRRGAMSPRAAWWDYAARWAVPALPAALAAAAALTLLLGRLAAPVAAPPTTVATARITMEAALGAAPRDLETTVVASTDQDELLRAAVAR